MASRAAKICGQMVAFKVAIKILESSQRCLHDQATRISSPPLVCYQQPFFLSLIFSLYLGKRVVHEKKLVQPFN